MSTRSFIAILNGNDSVKSVYCHWDGYPEHNGKVLTESYNTPEKIQKLLGHGDISSLDNKIGKRHSFETRVEGTCTFYKRDRGEKGVEARVMPVSEFESYIADSWAEYVYLFKENEWYVSGTRNRPFKFERVADVLAKEKAGAN